MANPAAPGAAPSSNPGEAKPTSEMTPGPTPNYNGVIFGVRTPGTRGSGSGAH